MLATFQRENILVLDYTDDIAWCWENMKQVHKAIKIMKTGETITRWKLNSEKSGIMRILNRKVKSKGIKNELEIPEVLSYPYLGIIINQ